MPISALNAGLSAMQGYQRAMGASAHNIANMQTQNFQAEEARFDEQAGGGVTVSLSAAGGSNSLEEDVVNQMQYKSGFQLAAKVVQAADDMLGTLVNIRA